MNKYFYYYRTYDAARLAGQEADDALVNACSAKFADECDKEMLED